MPVPIGFFRNKNFTRNQRGALKIDAIFATDDAEGTEPFQGWLADATVVDSFNDALIENRIGVVDTENFNLTLANRFAFTTMSEGRRLRQREVIFVEFNQPIVLDDADPVLRGADIEFRSNGFPFGSTLPNSNGNCYRIFSVIREKSITIENIQLNGDNTATIFVDDREDLTAFNPATSTGNNYNAGDTIVVEEVSPTDYNGSYVIQSVNLNEITIIKDNATPVYNTGGEVYLASNKLLLTEVNRAKITGASFVAGVDNIQISTATIEAEAKISSGATITGTGIGPAATPNTNVIASYNSVTKTIELSFPTSSSLVNGTLLIEQEAVNNIPIPSGAFVSSTAGFPQPLVNAGQVSSSRTVKIGSEKYYVYGDSRLKYFWSTFTNDTGPTIFDGFEQNVDGDNFLNQFVASNPALGQVTTQLIGNDSVFASEDTFNNLIKTLGTNRSDLSAVRKDYSPQSGAALLYISATDSQGETGGTTRKGLGTTVPAYSVTEAVEAVKDNLGYWVGVIGGSFSKGANNSDNCQNEIQPFLQNSSDGILGDPRGFIPIIGEVTSIRVGVPIDTVSYDIPSSTVTCTTYYDHQYGAINDELRIRIKNSDDADLNGLKDITVTGAKTFTFEQQNFTFTAIPANWDSYGYGLNITDLLTVPTGFYRKSQILYKDTSAFNDSRTQINRDLPLDPSVNLAFSPGAGAGALERKELLITVFVTETEGTLQFFDSYAFGNFFVGLPTTDSGTEYYFAYPTDGKDIKFALAVDNLNTLQRSIATLLDAGNDTVAAGTEFDAELYAIEHTADIVAQDPSNTWIEVLTSSIDLFDNKGEGRDFTNLDSSGSGYNDGVQGAVSFSGGLTNLRGGTGYTVNGANVSVTGGSGSGLTVNYASDGDTITSVSVQDQGEGYLATDTDLVITGGNNDALIDIGSIDTPKVTFSADDVATTATTGVGTDLTFDISVINGEITNITINNRGTGYAVGDTGEIEAVAGATAPTVKATYSVKSIDTSQLVELSFETVPPGTQLSGLSSRTGIVSIVDSPSSPGVNTRITLNKSATDNNVGREVSFISPGKNRIQRVFVKNSNNFKDIDVKPEAQEPIGEVPVTSDASITFSGYGYSIGDVLTPSDVTNPPASVSNAVWTFDTKIAFDGFVASGLSPEGTISDVFVNLSGDESGTGASFRVTQSSGGFYNVELLEQGFGFTPGEEIIIPGYAQALDGLEVPNFVTFSDKGTGGTPGDYTNVTITPVGAETGINVTLNFTIDDGGQIVPSSVTFNTDETSTGFRLGDEYDVTGAGGFTSAPRFIVQRTPNDITIRITGIDDNSSVALTTAAPHGFTPPLGRTAVDIFVENVESVGGNALNATGYNGRFSAEVVDGVTLVYPLSLDPGTYTATTGTVYNVSIDVINDTFAAFNNKLFWNINAPTNDPVYPYIRRVSAASIVALDTIEITTSEPHGLINGDEVRISGLIVERERDWDLAKVQITTVGVGDPSLQFRYTKTGVSGGAAVSYITGGEVTNPYVKVLGGVYTKDFNRIVFVNTTTTEQDSIPPDKTQDFFVRQINLKQIANDGFEVKPGSEHNFYVTGNNELSLTRRTDIEITRIEYIPLTLEYELACNEPHGLWVGNRIQLVLTTAGDSIVNNDGNTNDGPAAYESPPFSGQDPPEDLVSTRISDTVFRIKTFLDSRAPVDNPGTAGNNGDGVIEADGTFNPIGTPIATFTKEIGDPEIFQGVVGGFPQDIIQFTGLSGSPGISTEGFYYIIAEADENDGGITSRRSFQISRSKTGGPISFFVNIAEATYNRALEIARIEVPSATPHGLQSGDNINVTGVASDSYNGSFTVVDVLSEIAFTYSLPPIQGSPDTTAYAASRVLADTAGAAIQKRCNFDGTSPALLALRNNQDKVDIIPGMLIVGTTTQTNDVLTNAQNDPYRVLGFSPGPGAAGGIVMSEAGDAAQSIGGGGQFFEFRTGVTDAKAVEIQGNVDLPNIINAGQLISPVTATAFDTDTYVVSVYFTSAGEFEDIPTDDGRTTFDPATDRVFIELSKPLIGNLTNGQTFDLIDNDSPSRSIRVTAFTEAPKVGDEIVNTDLSNNQLSTIQTGTTIQSVVPYDLTGSGGLDGFILELSSALLSDVNTGLLKIYPASPVAGTGQITGVQATLVGGSEVIDNQNTTIAGQVRLTADITGWDHVTLAQNTGGALFFQLGYPLFCTGTQGSTTITVPVAQNFTNALVDLNDEPGNATGYGAYGDGIFQGSVISSINLGANQITLDSPLTRDVNNYVGFARPNSVSIFPKYTQEFGRILGKTFAEWLFKIA